MQRAAISITSNIAEGFSRSSTKEKYQFYSIALGSLAEVQSQLLLARDLTYIGQDVYLHLAEQTVEVSKLLNGLMRGLFKMDQRRFGA
jgi:four helix bundle protein